MPGWPYAWAPAAVPAWFTGTARRLPLGTDTLVYPLASNSDASAMVWQAMANMRSACREGTPSSLPARGGVISQRPSSLQEALAFCTEGDRFPLSTPAVRSDLRTWHVQLVTVAQSAPGAYCATRLSPRHSVHPVLPEESLSGTPERSGPPRRAGRGGGPSNITREVECASCWGATVE